MSVSKKIVLDFADCLYGFIQQAAGEALNSNAKQKKVKAAPQRMKPRKIIFRKARVLDALKTGGLTPRELVIALRGRDYRRDRCRAQVALINLCHAGLVRKNSGKGGKYLLKVKGAVPMQKAPRVVELKRMQLPPIQLKRKAVAA